MLVTFVRLLSVMGKIGAVLGRLGPTPRLPFLATSGPTFNQNEPLGSKTLTSLDASFLLPPPSAEFRRLPQTRVHTPKCSPKLPSTASGNSCAPPPSMLSTSFSSRSSSCPRPSLNAEVFPEAAFHSFGEQMRSSAHNEPARSLQQRSHTPKCSPKPPSTASGSRCVPPPSMSQQEASNNVFTRRSVPRSCLTQLRGTDAFLRPQ